jgi:uncharacterized membrane protein (DUF4010 family)
MPIDETFLELGISLGLGLLVGLQRESRASRLAGLRTFALVTLLGTLSVLLIPTAGPWLPAAALLAVALLVAVSNFLDAANKSDPGITTEVSLLLMFCVGALAATPYREAAIALGGLAAVLLHFKQRLHGAVARLEEGELKAIMQFALLSLVILPVLPDRAFDPWGVLNPRHIWWIVVLVVGIDVTAFIAHKLFAGRAGTLLGGILGGLVSSTATTMSWARRSRADAADTPAAAAVILIASATVFARVLAFLAALSPALFLHSALRFLLLGTALFAGLLFTRGAAAPVPSQDPQRNPSELKPALLFAGFYTLALLAVAAAKAQFGPTGLYAVALLAGLTDVDVVTLSSARLASEGQMLAATASNIIVAAILANLASKAAIAAFAGGPKLLARIAPGFALCFAAGLLILFL